MKKDPKRSIDEYKIGQFGYQVGLKQSNPDDNNSPRIPYIREVTITELSYPDRIGLIDNELQTTVFLTREDAMIHALQRHKDQLDFLKRSFDEYKKIDPLENLEIKTQTDTLDEFEYLTNTNASDPRLEVKPTDDIPTPKYKLGQEVYCISYDRSGFIRMSGEERKIVYQIIHTQIQGINIIGMKNDKKGISYNLFCEDRVPDNWIFETLEQAKIVRQELIQEKIDYFTELLQNETVIDERQHNAEEREKKKDEDLKKSIGSIVNMFSNSSTDDEDDNPSNDRIRKSNFVLNQTEIDSLLGFDKEED